MKKLFFTSMLAFFGLTGMNAQTTMESTTTTFEGVIVGTSENLVAHELTHVVQQGGAVKYIIRETTTGLDFETLPYPAELAPGTKVAFVITGSEGSTDLQKSKHDAAMAAIQNTR